MRKVLIPLILLITAGNICWYVYDQTRLYWETHEVREFRVPGKWAPHYLATAKKYRVSWFYLASIDEVRTGYEKVSRKSIENHARQLRKLLDRKEDTPQHVEQALLQLYPRQDVIRMMQIADSYAWEAAPLSKDYQFPFRRQDRHKVAYSDTWGESRTYGGKRKHEGIDLMAPKGTPVVSVADGEVIRKGWNRLGGWRLLVQDADHPYIYYYYAHFSKYAKNIEEGDKVKKGQTIGYVGDSGYGPEGTTGKFRPHLHFGMYVREGMFSIQRDAVNPFPFLRVWDEK
ncbi:M23 family metallopeptidase [Lihuaxuella thermophila]|uniref:Peptidase family M23 n=1 Tax=Lihuaxuella thermophila TaxID=1173111 RepID=A0A1H8CZS4_9BACL|nr:M23 family metallopeptidase [Lihuaxuella thermophila]SEN00442.1 Peptidase family M23 [Lihuaxuella thermophila]